MRAMPPLRAAFWGGDAPTQVGQPARIIVLEHAGYPVLVARDGAFASPVVCCVKMPRSLPGLDLYGIRFSDTATLICQMWQGGPVWSGSIVRRTRSH